WCVYWPSEPFVSHTSDTDTELITVTCHSCNYCTRLNSSCCIHHCLPVAIATFKKNWSVSDKNCITSVRFSLSMWSNEDITGAISRKNAYEEAILRWWNSSPIAIAFA